jgi:transposase InsO family protein
MAKNLQKKGYSVGRYKARSLMRKAGIVSKQRRRYRVTTDSRHTFPVAKNVLNREFAVATPNQVWVTDITYLWTLEGWVYVAAVLDLFSRRIVGWSIASHMRETLVNDALTMALGRRQPASGLLHHSDRGVQYASHDYQDTLKAAGITVSMSRKGNCWDNAVMERFWGSLKSERTDSEIYLTREAAKADVIDYIEMFYNSKRLHSTLDYFSPMQFEKQFFSNKVSTFT